MTTGGDSAEEKARRIFTQFSTRNPAPQFAAYSPMSSILDIFESNLHDLEWRYQLDEEHELLRFGVNCANGSFEVIIHVVADIDLVKCYTLYPVRVPEERRAAVAEYLTRANYGLLFGNFEMDYADGEVRFRTSMNTDDAAINSVVARHLLQQNVNTADRYFNGLLRVVYGALAPASAIQEAENVPERHLGEDDET